MIRIKRIIRFSEIPEIIKRTEIRNISIYGSKSRGLENPEVLRVFMFLTSPNMKDEFNSIFGLLQKYKLIPLGTGDNSYIKGIIPQKNLGWLSITHIKKLQEIEKRNDIHFGISKNIIKLIQKYGTTI